MIPHPPSSRRRRGACTAAASGLALLLPNMIGCPSVEMLPTDAPIRDMVEPTTAATYLLYVPSNYRDDRRWPVVVACHGTWPYDTADHQMREWARFGERKGIIVVAPRLAATKGDFPPSPREQIELQAQDERAILRIVKALKRTYRVAEEQVFMTGWSAASYTILYTGLRNPDIFRALAIRQGTFDERFLDVPSDRLDPWQPIKVIFGSADFLREQSKSSIDWLRKNGLRVSLEEIPGTHRRIDPTLAWRFFEEVTREHLWLRVRAAPPDPGKPLTLQFAYDCKPPAVQQKWFFGDETDSYETAPLHTYAEPGPYEVTLNVRLAEGKSFSRKKRIRVGWRTDGSGE